MGNFCRTYYSYFKYYLLVIKKNKMGLDIKLPIGAMFLIFGILLTVFGITTEGSEMYNSSLNININLWSGGFMLLFGSFMLVASYFTKKRNK